MTNPANEDFADFLIRLHPDLSRRQAEDVVRLAYMRDEDIDLSDIPEIQEIPPNAVRGKFYRGRMIRQVL